METFSALELKAEQKYAENSARSLHLQVAHGMIRAGTSSEGRGSGATNPTLQSNLEEPRSRANTTHNPKAHGSHRSLPTTATVILTPRRSNTVPKNMQRVDTKQQNVAERQLPSTSVTISKRPSTLPEPTPKRRRPQNQDNPSAVGPRPKLKEPWHALMDSAIQLYFGNDATLPSLNNLHTVETASTYKKTLYQIALMKLHEAKSIYKRPNFDKTRCLYFKDAFLALSAVWYLYTPMANELFGNERTQEAKDLCYIPDLEIQSEDVQSIVKPLLK
ncbi:hypothetical protein EDD21DRAFT_117748 [Dissophora ornata]|nr:hypothetical protein EDD21DRAFT_117748 [Dissophora ornata]